MRRPRPVRPEQVADLADLLSEVFGFQGSYPRERIIADLSRPQTRRRSLVITHRGKPVSHIRTLYDVLSIYGCSVKVASIGAVATHPEHRGRGCASAILNQSLDRMLSAGAKVLIVSGNRGLYRRAHCLPAGRIYLGETRRADWEQDRGSIAVRRVPFDSWPLLAPLHQAEPVRFLRPADFLRGRCFWWDCHNLDLWLMESNRQPIAYLALAREGINQPEAPKLMLWEYAGSRAALLDGLPALFRATGLQAIRLRVLGHDREFLHLLRQRGVAMKPSPLPGTHRLLDLPGLMRTLRPYLAARLPRPELRQLSFDQRRDTCLFAYGSETAELTLSDAVKIVLGGPAAPKLPAALAPVLSAIFPLPFPMPGFNYV